MLVTDALSLLSGDEQRGEDARIRAETERGESELREAGVELLTTSRQRMFGVDVVQLDGVRAGLHVSFRIYDRGNLRFEFRCIGGTQATPWPCDAAFAHVDFGAPPPAPLENATARPLHVRSESAGFTFDAPDDTWLSTGPHTGTGGAEVIWMWEKDGSSIAVQTMNLSMYPPSRAFDVQTLADGFRRKSRRVQVKSARSATGDWTLLETDDPRGIVQDLFLITRERYAYLVIVTTAQRDPALRERARKGFRFIEK
jgi:hypothetical protein